MKNNRYKELSNIWLNRAQDDILWAQDSLKTNHFSGVCFLGQQAAEKALKAYLFLHQQKLIRTHNLLRLLEKCVILDKDFIKIKDDCIILNDYYIDTRYPDIWDRDKFDEKTLAEEALASAIEAVCFVRNIISPI